MNNRIVVVGDHYAAMGGDDQVIGVVCRAASSPGQWMFHPVVNDHGKVPWNYVQLQMALDQAKSWATYAL